MKGLRYAMVTSLVVSMLACPSDPQVGDPRPLVRADDDAATHLESLKSGDLNVLFIVIDTLRASHLRIHGYPRDTSPTLDSLAATGLSFRNHEAQSSWTKCSMASMWTSLSPQHTGVLRAPDVLPSEAVLPAEILRDAGFVTAGIWRNGWVHPNFGFGQGFEVYQRPLATPVPAAVRRQFPQVIAGSDDDVTATAAEFMRQQRGKRWFLYLHLMDLHQYVYDEDTALFGSGNADLYDNALRHTDRVISDLVALLSHHDLLTRTLIVIGSDHGEAFGEHGNEGHARNVHREVTHVPFIMGFPFRLERPIFVQNRTQNVDIWPTLYELLGLAVPEGLDGRSMLPSMLELARGRPEPALDRPTFAYLDRSWGRFTDVPSPLLAVSKGAFRLHYSDGPRARPALLYDLARDPHERRNLRNAHPGIVDELASTAREALDQAPAWSSTEQLEIDEMDWKHLRALGYTLGKH